MTQVIIPAAGNNHSRIFALASDIPDALIPINGRPVLDYILEELEKQKMKDIIIVTTKHQQELFSVIFRKYKQKFNISILPIDKSTSLLDTIAAAKSKLVSEDVLVALSDTIFSVDIDFSQSVLYFDTTKEAFRWCLAEQNKDGSVKSLVDKPKNYPPGQHKALIGVYYFKDSNLFFECLSEAIGEQRTEISAPIMKMIEKGHAIFLKKSNRWIDCGSIDNYFKAKRTLIQSRHFNNLKVNETYGVLSKRSRKKEKLLQEYEWYTALPMELQSFTPRVFSYKDEGEMSCLDMEYYGYSSLSEYFVYTTLPFDLWESILDHVFEVIDLFYSKKGKLNETDFESIYRGKNIERVKMLEETSQEWKERIERDSWEVNGTKCAGYKQLMEYLEGQRFYREPDICISHGDLCFTNILYDINGHTMKLIDPRGAFGRKGIYGDIKYDLAKLRHSAHGGYDFIVNDLFEIQEDGNSIRYEIYENKTAKKISDSIDRRITEMGYDIKTIQAIEGMLFLSMIPLHSDKPERQKIMNAKALEILSEVFYENRS